MQPRKLILKNFGPFIDETLDFSRLSESSLFLISGKTGSGKTTLFDGMTYALFGETSGRLRLGKDMRSSFASTTEETAVSFLFEHQALLYLVERKPEQVLTKKKGEGVRTQAAKVSLTIMDASGKELRQYTKRGEVDQTIKELLHLDAKQFSQIVLLPQGEFRNFLIANSNEKEAVLRNLFGTQLYQSVNDWLKEKVKQQQEQLNHLLVEADHLGQQFEWSNEPVVAVSTQELLACWEEELRQQQITVRKAARQFEELQKQQEIAEVTFYQSKELAEAFEQLERINEKQKQNVEKKQEIVALKEQEQSLRWAEKQQGLMGNLLATSEQIENLTRQKDQAVKTQTEKAVALTTWEARTNEHAAWIKQLKSQQEREQKVQFLLPIAKEYEALKTKKQVQENELAELSQQFQQMEEAQLSYEKKRAQFETIVKKRPEWQETKLSLFKTEQLVKEFTQDEGTHKNHLAKKEHLLQESEAFIERLEKSEERLNLKNKELTMIKSQWAKMQIARLSLLLVEGEPCPVCGATEHPGGQSEHQVYSAEMIRQNEEDLALAEEQVATAQQTFQQQQAEQKQLERSLEETRQQEQELLKQVKGSEQRLSKQMKTSYSLSEAQQRLFVEKAYAALLGQIVAQHEETEAQINLAEQQVSEINQMLEQLKIEQTKGRQHLIEKENKLGELTGQLQSIVKQMGEESFQQLEEEVTVLATEIQQLQKQIHEYEEQGQRLREDLLRIKEQVASLEQQETNQRKTAAEIQKTLDAVISESPVVQSVEELQGLLAAVQQLESMQQTIHDYEQEQVVLESQRQTLKEKIGESQQPDLSAVQLIWEEKKEELLASQKQRVQKEEQRQRNEQLYKKLTELYQKSQEQLDEISLFQQLSQTINGENAYKTSLERYVLQAYLEEVLIVANQRLRRLTKNRYQFELSDGVGSYRSKTGLEINVYDDNAGATRSAHTLSGGESFIAALALALSLAEVIQSQAGGVTIEALFIDEGFGSLDEDSLEMAMEALETIENEGRMIGIISHVRELKDRILQQVLVKSTGTGQSTIDYQLNE
ncbi:DNA repair protein SbcC/Rad50 [Enterococcus sp. AZ194]